MPRTCLIQPQLLCQGAKNFRRFHPFSGIAEKAHSYAAKGPGRQHTLEVLQIAGKMVKNRKPWRIYKFMYCETWKGHKKMGHLEGSC